MKPEFEISNCQPFGLFIVRLNNTILHDFDWILCFDFNVPFYWCRDKSLESHKKLK